MWSINVHTPAIQRALNVGISGAAHGASTSSSIVVLASLALEQFTITGDAWSIAPTQGIIVDAMVARAKDHVDGEAHRGHEQKENNPLRIHCVSLTF